VKRKRKKSLRRRVMDSRTVDRLYWWASCKNVSYYKQSHWFWGRLLRLLEWLGFVPF